MTKSIEDQYISCKTITDWKTTKWLVLSSGFIMFPALYAQYHNMYFFANLLYATSAISANYWRKATFSWRRNTDLISAKISFTIFLVNGILYNKPQHLYRGYISLIILTYCYYMSGKFLDAKNPEWYKYHFLFHVYMTYELFLVIDSIRPLEN